MKPAVVFALCLFGVAFIAASMGAEWWLTRQIVVMAAADQANAKAEQDTFRQALAKMPSLVVSDPVMSAASEAVGRYQTEAGQASGKGSSGKLAR